MRLVDLGKNPRNNGMRLVSTGDLEGPVKYAVVCKPRGSMFSIDTALKMKEALAKPDGLHWREVPQQFQDIAVLAHEQDIRYLWVNHLCIMSENPYERTWHLDQIDAIFGQAYITLVGGNGDSKSSLFRRQLPNSDSHGMPSTVSIELSKAGRKYTVHARQELYTAHFDVLGRENPVVMVRYDMQPPAAGLNNDFAHFLNDEDFILQQLMLSPRVLHIHPLELLWECGEATKCECRVLDGVEAKTTRQRLRSHHQKRTTHSMAWSFVQEEYHRRVSLSALPSERLLHIAGLARWWQENTRLAYLAGIFARSAEDLAQSLLWNICPLPGRSTRQVSGVTRYHSPGVPSWSPFSMTALGKYTYYHGNAQNYNVHFSLDRYFKFLDVTYKTPPGAREDPFMAGSWTLHIEGRLLLATVDMKTVYHSVAWFNLAPANESCGPNMLAKPGWYQPIGHPSLTPMPPQHGGDQFSAVARFKPDCDFWVRDQAERYHSQGQRWVYVYLLVLGKTVVGVPGVQKSPTHFSHVGLVLRRSPSKLKERQGFERIGTFISRADLGYFMQSQTGQIDLV